MVMMMTTMRVMMMKRTMTFWHGRGYRPPHTRPRLFLPYYEECKVRIIHIIIIAIIIIIIMKMVILTLIFLHQTLLSERSGGVTGDTSSFNFHRMSEIPDTLYMVSIIAIIIIPIILAIFLIIVITCNVHGIHSAVLVLSQH